MPAYAGAASADEMPGTTSKRMPFSTSASASSDPRPKTNGSPPLSRTTRLPACAWATSWALISSWRGAVPVQLVLPTSTTSASRRSPAIMHLLPDAHAQKASRSGKKSMIGRDSGGRDLEDGVGGADLD